ncbi:MAG TPA: sigma-54 dependent transcriptional regulator [Candidatus Hydrogenedentes bacterium]|nr:sigma-54 dependent transcriptional regulator [Candidatus Hydrogenedentota bacterium]
MGGARVLVIDDDPLMREFLSEALRRGGYTVDVEASGASGLECFARERHDIIITDLKMPGMDGLTVLRKARELDAETQVIIMTAYGTIDTAVAALREGASDYLLKPFRPDALTVTVSRALERARLLRENTFLRRELNAGIEDGGMVGNSPPMREVYEQIRRIADSRATVLVRGESGTGKELVARAIHHFSRRRDKPFIRVNCAALSAGILESELFGHERGAFTGAHDRKIGRFELANGGSILLDEISEIGVELQPKLLRVLQEFEFERVGGTQTISVDTRVIATSNRNLEQAVAVGRFREDLFFRLNVVTIHLPPLRERREDIPLLLEHFLRKSNRDNGRNCTGYTHELMRVLMEYPWPGNVRELQNAVERAVLLSDGEGPLDVRHFNLAGPLIRSAEHPKAEPSGKPTHASADVPPAVAPAAMDHPLAFRPGITLDEMERRMILATLEHCGGNR